MTRSLVTLGEVAHSAGATRLHSWHSEAGVQTQIWRLAEVKEEEKGGGREEKEEREDRREKEEEQGRGRRRGKRKG